MSDVVISVENLSKRYLVGHNAAQSEHRADFRELVSRNVSSLARKTRDMLSGRPLVQGDAVEEFWALNDVSFEVRHGERLGIIGRNGAGKSTLLKILSRITEPTKGRVRITGRVASLLEVGTGFHAELSGRENIYLNGAMLGMSRAEVHRKFDEIVAFADVERFLDTPVKRYSSGMYVRLAFAVAAHLEPEILIVDEVLAVGDAQFQRKCMGRMQEVAHDGRAILYVSHSMASVQSLCTRTIYLEEGKVRFSGATEDAVSEYLRSGALSSQASLEDRKDRVGNGLIRFLSFELCEFPSRARLECASSGNTVVFRIMYASKASHEVPLNFNVEIGIDDHLGNRISHLSNISTNQVLQTNKENRGLIDIEIPNLPLCKGMYGFTLFSTVGGDVADWIKNAGSFYVEEGDFFRTGKVPPAGQGTFYMKHAFVSGSVA